MLVMVAHSCKYAENQLTVHFEKGGYMVCILCFHVLKSCKQFFIMLYIVRPGLNPYS